MIKENYKIRDHWKISPNDYKFANQYFLSDELQNNRLLISSFINGKKYVPGNRFHRYILKEFSNSKILFLDTNNFEEIKSTKIFNEKANYMILENYIIIQADNETLLYDINSLDLIQNIEFPEECGILYKFDNKYIFSYFRDIKEKTLTIYKIENNKFKFIKQFKLESAIFNQLISLKFKWIIKYYKFLFVLKVKRIIINFDNNMFILKFPSDNLN